MYTERVYSKRVLLDSPTAATNIHYFAPASHFLQTLLQCWDNGKRSTEMHIVDAVFHSIFLPPAAKNIHTEIIFLIRSLATEEIFRATPVV